MAKIINIDNDTALVMNEFKKSIAYMSTVNINGRYNDQIDIEKKALKSFFDDVLERKVLEAA